MNKVHLAKLMATCVHFTGVQHKVCKAGLKYDSVRDDAKRFPQNLPCLRVGETSAFCEQRQLPTQAEAMADAARFDAAFEEFLAKAARGECVVCGLSVEPRKQVGRCIYAACGHRIGQGAL